MGLLVGAVALVAGLGLALSTTAGAASGYPGTTTVTTDPGGSSPGGTTSPGGATSPSGGSGPSDACVVSPASCASSVGIPSTGSSSDPGTLAFTGADLLALIVGALFLLAAGTLSVVFTRRRATHQPI
ncbi:MAG TPA: hypothetical protein VG412_13775 [Acidimicrobiales bacterium]|nr:hypothetical protein [Acidimicrobiales bacterium]